MSDMKCPVCNVLLDECGDLLCCPNDHCAWVGNKELWQELTRTRKALEIAINAIKSAKDYNAVNCVARGKELSTDDVHITLFKALEQITALEQKDVK